MERVLDVEDGEVTAYSKCATTPDASSTYDSSIAEDGTYLTGWKLRVVTLTLALGMFLVGIDSSIIGVVTPKITTAFHSMDDIAWYGSGYMLPHTVLQPTLGTLYKSFHVTYVYFFSVVIFELGSCLCAAAPTSTLFIIGRVISGCGAAGVLQGTLNIISNAVPKKKVPLYFGYVLSVQGISACSAPIFGGIFSDKVSWRWCFWINLPIGGLALIVIPLLFKPRPAKKSARSLPLLSRLQRIDWLGTTLFTASFACLFLALQWAGQTKPWESSIIIGLFVGFGLLLGAFALSQRFMGDRAILPVKILKQRTVLFGTIYLILFGLHVAVYLYYIPIYFQAVHGTSAINSGIRMIALDAARIIFIIVSGAIVSKFQHYMPYMAVGTAISCIGASLLVTLNTTTTTALSTAFLFIVGAGAGIGGNQPFTALQAVLRDEDMSIGNGLTVFGLQLGTSVAFAVSQTVFLTKIFHKVEMAAGMSYLSRTSIVQAGASHLEDLAKDVAGMRVLREAYSAGIKDTMIVALVAICLSLFCLPGMEWVKLGEKREEKKEDTEASIGVSSHGEEA